MLAAGADSAADQVRRLLLRFVALRFFELRFFELRFFELRFFVGGTFAPSLRASERPIAIACLRLVTFLPERPLRNVPRLRSRMTFSTFFDAFLLYLRAMKCSVRLLGSSQQQHETCQSRN
jgi:hypothetical protein